MCGLIANFRKDGKPIDKQRLVDRFNNQKSRGTEGLGFVSWANKKIEEIKRFTNTAEAFLSLGELKDQDGIMFHHRMPTSTENEEQCAHPIYGETERGVYALIHNGVIGNPDKLKRKHEEIGVIYNSFDTKGKFNDSESLLWELIIAEEKDEWNKLEAEGSYAFVLVKADKEMNIKEILFGTNGASPLYFNSDKKEIEIGSVNYQDEFDKAEDMALYKYNIEKKKLTIIKNKIPKVETKYYYAGKWMTWEERKIEQDKLIIHFKGSKKERKKFKHKYKFNQYGDDEDVNGYYGGELRSFYHRHGMGNIDTTSDWPEDDKEPPTQEEVEYLQAIADARKERRAELYQKFTRAWQNGVLVEIVPSKEVTYDEIVELYKIEKEMYREINNDLEGWKSLFKEECGWAWIKLINEQREKLGLNRKKEI